MEIMVIVIVFMIVIPISLAVYNIRNNSGSTKKRIKAATAIFAAVIVCAFAAAVISDLIDESERSGYSVVASDGLLGGCRYKGDEDGYHIIAASKLLNSSEIYAVPESVRLPFLAKIWPRCSIYAPEGIEERTGIIDLSVHKGCIELNEDVMIKGSYFLLMLEIMVFTLILFALYETFRAVRTFSMLGKDKEK